MLKVLVPSTEFVTKDEKREARLAPKPDTLDGKVVGIFHHRGASIGGAYPGQQPFLKAVEDLLRARFNLAGVVWSSKPNLSRVVSNDIAEELAARADVVIHGTCS